MIALPSCLVQRARQRVEEEKEDESLNPDSNPDILRIHAAMSKVITQAEAAGEQGEIDAAQVRKLIMVITSIVM